MQSTIPQFNDNVDQRSQTIDAELTYGTYHVTLQFHYDAKKY